MATINGDNGNNVLNGTAFDDIINGLGGNDDLFGHGGNDVLNGGNRRDDLDGGEGNDTLNGGNGRDTLRGGAGDDDITGGNGNDTVYYTGNLGDYVIVQNPDGSFTIQDTRTGSPDGTDTVRTVESFVFSDGTYSDSNLLAENQAAQNAAPVANDDTASVDEDNSVNINVLGNDTDGDGDTLSVTAASAPNGSVVINGDNTLTYTPDADFNGSDTITYTVDDGNGGTDTATVAVTVNAVNDDPVASDDTASLDEDGNVVIDVLGNDTDADGDSLTVTAASAPNGTVVINGDNTVTYTPDPDYNGSDTITYTVDDGNGGTDTATVAVTVNAVNDDPVASDDTASVDDDSNVVIDVLGNDTDADGHSLSVSAATAANGTVTINGDNTLTYTPDAEFNGTDTISYTVDDGNGGTDTADVTVTVNAVNDAPTDIELATPITSTVRNAVILNAGFEADVLADGGGLNSASDWTLTGFPAGVWNAATRRFTDEAPEGQNTLFAKSDATASQTLSETLAANGDLKLTFQVGDGLGAPDSDSWEARLYAGTTLLKSVDNSDFDPANDSFVTATLEMTQAELAAFSSEFGQALRIEFVGGAASGEWAFFDDVALEVTEYAPQPAAVDENDAGAVVGDLTTTDPDAGDSHTYTVSDSRFEVVGGQLKLKDGISLDFDTEPTVDVTVTTTDSGGLTFDKIFTLAVNDLGDVVPVAVDDTATTDENVNVIIDVLANDTDGDGDTLTVTTASATNGTVVINADNTITYTPNPEYYGSDTITYSVTDGFGGEDTADVLVTVNQANEVPVGNDDDAGDTDYETPLVIQAAQLLANDTDADLDTLTVQAVHDAQNGTVSMDASGNITFTPDAGFSGNTTFKYTVTDGIDTAEATVNLFVEVNFSDYIGNWWAETIDLSGSPLPCYIECGRGNDTLLASNLRDAIVGGFGDDSLNGGGGDDDFLIGMGDGFDSFEGGSGYDVVKATAENVKIGLIGNFNASVEEFSCAGFDNVSITGTWQAQVMDFSNVTLTDITYVDAGFGNDTVTGSAGNDVLIGNKGDDTLNGGAGDDDFLIRLGDGFDTFDGGAGFDQILADGDNVNIGILNGFANDVEEISANGNTNVGILGKWYAQIFDFSNTVLDGIAQIDLDGGDDTAIGSAGDDTIIGGRGDDTLTGGLGADTFVFRNEEGDDVVTDFEIGIDTVQLDGVVGFGDYASVQAAMTQDGADVLLDFGGNHHSIRFEDTLLAALTSDQFEFI